MAKVITMTFALEVIVAVLVLMILGYRIRGWLKSRKKNTQEPKE